MSLDVSQFIDALHPLREKYCEWLPKFNATSATIAEKRMHEFYWVMSAQRIMEEDVVSILFSLTLEDSVRDCYLRLP